MARLTNAQWFAVSVFEAVIDLPGRISREPGSGAFGEGSPARYHVPTAPLILGAAVGAAVTAPASERTPLVVSAACTGVSAAVTVHLVRTVNVPLLTGAAPERSRQGLIDRWHALNKVRLVLLAGAGVALEVAARRRR
nr:anthrone oxygenase family protein [Prauserella cavernicola]